MSYRISPYNSIQEEIRDVINEQNDKAIRTINNMDISIDEQIHDTRKRFKKIRAAILLIRHCIPKKTYKELNILYRDLGRELAPLRDGRVKVKNFNKLLKKHHNQLTVYRSFEEVLMVNYSKTQEVFEKNDIPGRRYRLGSTGVTNSI